MLELQSIDKRLGAMQLSDISLMVDRGQCLVLLGPSGVGKTVLLEIVAGLTKPDAGKILWDGTDVTSHPPEVRRFAVVYQDYALFPHMTVARNITYGLRAAGVKASEARERLADMAQMLGIQPILSRRPGSLSGGEQQRVALARALAARPRLLLLDEPLASLDTNTRLRLRRELKRINRELSIPILHVTHDPEEAMVLGDRVGVMLGGRIRQVAPPEELFRTPSDPDVAAFLGLWNVLPVAEVRGNECLTHGQWIHASSADGSVSYLWIKPEEIVLSTSPFDSSARNQLKCRVVDWDYMGALYAVRVECGDLKLIALITHASFEQLGVAAGAELYATFKSSSIHCF